MKRFILPILSCVLFASNLVGSDRYQKGTLELIPDTSFAQGVDWSKIFIANLPTPPKPNMTTHVSLALAPDNTIYVVEYNNLAAGRLLLFDSGGKLQSIKPDASEKVKPGAWLRKPTLAVVNDKNELWISESRGLARCDRQGHVLAITKFDHPTSDFLFLKSGELMLSSTVVTNNPSKPFKLSISLLNLQTAKEMALASYYQSPFVIKLRMKSVTDKGKESGMVVTGKPATVGKLLITGMPDGKAVAGYADSPDILIFSPEGRKIGGFTLPIQRPMLSPELKAQTVQRISKNLDSLAANKKVEVPANEIEQAKDKLKEFPSELPYYSNLLVDEQGNILVFLTNSGNSAGMEFMAFSQSGKLLGTCRLVLPQGLSFRLDRRRQMVLRDGWLYALVYKNSSGTDQLQLARFKIE